MIPSGSNRDRFQRSFLLVLVIAISAIFFMMIRQFLMALFLAAIFSGLASPLYGRIQRKIRGPKGERRALASILTILILLLVVVGPLSALLGIVTNQALEVSEVVGPWVQEQIRHPDQIQGLLPDWVPFIDRLEPYRGEIIARLGESAGKVGSFLFSSLQAATKGTVAFFFYLIILLYAMFFFLKDGRELMQKIMYYTPLSLEDKERMLDRFVSVTRATLKGTLAIGMLQGLLAGVAFAVVGIAGAAFWGAIMAVLSVIPGIGAALVWVPAVGYLLVKGYTAKAIGLAIWCAAVVGSADNVLRPRLVGKDTKMPDLLILLSTLGGIFLFGAAGFIIGPIIAALFVTVWDIYGSSFSEVLEEEAPETDEVLAAMQEPGVEAYEADDEPEEPSQSVDAGSPESQESQESAESAETPEKPAG
jgi:predicted PurR-regulated permease PerM